MHGWNLKFFFNFIEKTFILFLNLAQKYQFYLFMIAMPLVFLLNLLRRQKNNIQ